LKKCLSKIWEQYDEECEAHIKDNVNYSEKNFQMYLDKGQLEQKLKKVQIELGKALSATEAYVPGVTAENLQMQRMLKDRALQQRDELKVEKKKLEAKIAELVKAGEVNQEKLNKMKEIMEG
jgi:ATP-dependent protease HslVU (ClpYQ) ATPase subunit